MKIRVIGTGYPHARHPLIPCTYLIQLDSTNIIIGCPPQIGSKLESINMKMSDIDLWILGDTRVSQSGGVEELSFIQTKTSKKPSVAATASILSKIGSKYKDGLKGKNIESLDTKSVLSVRVKDDNYEDSIKVIQESPTYSSYFFTNSKIAISHISKLDKFLEISQIMICDIDGEDDVAVEKLKELPVYVQQKLWVVGYKNDYQKMDEMFPILPLPQGSCIYDSERKEPYLSKERFIRDNAKRTAGNSKPICV